MNLQFGFRITIPTLALLLIGCEIKTMKAMSPDAVIDNPSAPAEVVKHLDINRYPLNKVVCNPLSTNINIPKAKQGLIGELYTLNSNQPNYSDVDDFITHGTKSDRKLFFSKLDVPTRMFNQGFPAETGELLKNDQGQVLMENFGMEIKTDLQLGPNDSPGDYQLAVLGDDGITVHVVENEVQTPIIDIRYVHPTQLGCANQTLSMQPGTKRSLKIRYAQGPRYHIALMLIWRRVTSTTPTEHRCGWAGNHTFFNPDNNSAPTAEYIAMQASGWKVVQPENYSVPGDVPFNPCSGENPPLIGDLAVKIQKDGQVHVSWKTDVGAASQILYKNTVTGVETLTSGDTKVKKNHQFEIKNLDPNVNYSFQAVSFSETFGKSLSAAMIVKPKK